MNKQKTEWMKEQIDLMDSNQHNQVFNIIKKYTNTFTKTQSGILVSTDKLSNDCLEEINQYINFSIDQKKRIEEDTKTRKTYERLITDL